MSLPAVGGVVDQSRLEQVHDKLQLPPLQQQYHNSLQSTHDVSKDHSSVIKDRVVDHIPLTYCEV